MQTWTASAYNAFLRIVDTDTLTDLHEFWEEYASIDTKDPLLHAQVDRERAEILEATIKKATLLRRLMESLGGFFMCASELAINLSARFWNDGHLDGGTAPERTHINSLFHFISSRRP